MYATDPVKDVDFGTALKISLDNYYDLLKAQVGGLASEEFLQLKLAADTIDLSADKKASEGGYVWFSYTNLLNRSDRAITPTPVEGSVQVGLEALADVYARFLRRLRTYVVSKVLTPAEQVQVAELDVKIDALKDQSLNYLLLDREKWMKYADAMGFSPGDNSAYVQWSSTYGNIRRIEENNKAITRALFERKTITNRQYPNPDDQEVVQAEYDLDNPMMRLRYPLYADYLYPEGDRFSPSYLAMLPLGSTALFEDRHAAQWDKTLNTIRTQVAGSFTASFDKQTQSSSSITTDWSGSASGSYSFIKVRANASEHKKIQDDFRTGKAITLGAESAMRINITFPAWFRPALFSHRHVRENPFDFQEFFGEKGSLLYYPTALIVIRGFSVAFESTQAWTYDYERKFSASGGGGFGAFGIRFGGSASYNSHQTQHEVDVSNTTLKIADSKETIRFVGYAVKKTRVFEQSLTKGLAEIFPPEKTEKKSAAAPEKAKPKAEKVGA
jgi:hypothetical protein